MGVSESLAGCGRVVGPVIGGRLFESLTPRAPFEFAALVSLLIVIIAISLKSASNDSGAPS
jgi:hypothetical protein